jgi:hypothetical protein
MLRVILLSAAMLTLAYILGKQNTPMFPFRATTIWHAFLLNSLAQSLVIVVTIVTRRIYEHKGNSEGITALTAFVTCMVAYCIMYALFGFGGGMLVAKAD